MKGFLRIAGVSALCLLTASCVNEKPSVEGGGEQPQTWTELKDLAVMFSELPLEEEHLQEVHAAVTESLSNGYDEEYTMHDLFVEPGKGVGTERLDTKAPTRSYSKPLRSLIEDYLGARTKAGEASVEGLLEALESSDTQVYWPYSERWDGHQYPVITYYPEAEAASNIGYEIVHDEDGGSHVQQVIVDEQMAMQRPVWVLNRNDDSGYESIEVRRRKDPEWGQGGEIYVKSGSDEDYPTLYLKDITLRKNFDCWLCGASEIVIHCGSVSGFTASTEAELKLYKPSVTNFMISIPRSKVGLKIPFNAVLISEFTPQLDMFAFLVNEDDGGTQTSWKTEATVKVTSKSYGFTLNIPLNVHDDIIWRGQLSSSFFKKNTGKVGNFGDVSLTFCLQ